MTTNPNRVPTELIVLPVPMPPARVELAYHELDTAIHGTDEQKKALGPVVHLPKPWDPETCQDSELRHEVWAWLESFVIWLNHEYTWDVADLIPSCWPLHPHLVHEVAVLADQRRRTMSSPTSGPLEEWHHYLLPSFVDRMRARLKDQCADGHKGWPARGRYTRHAGTENVQARERVYAADLKALNLQKWWARRTRRETVLRPFSIVDLGTGEVFDHPDADT